MTRHLNTGTPPRPAPDAIGVVSRHPHDPAKLRWSITGDDWDVAEYWAIGEGK